MKKSISLNKLELLERLQRNLAFGQATWLIGFVLILMAGLVSPALAQTSTGFASNTIIITGSRGPDKISPARYYTKSSDGTSSRPFDGQDLGEGVAFIRDQTRVDSLFINAESNTTTKSGDNIQSVRLLYRVYPTGTPPADAGSQIPLNLNPLSVTASGQGKWSYLTNKTNLINFATTDNNYTLEVAFEGSYTGNPNGVITDDKGGPLNLYKATFQVKAYNSAYPSVQWKASNNSKDWFDSRNWTPGNVPTAYTDVVIPYQSGGTYPVINRADGGVALVHNLTINGRNKDTSLGARLSLLQGSLYIYGDFRDLNSGFSQSGVSPTTVGYLYLTGQTQLFDASPKLRNLFIAGGGIKTITGVVEIIDSVKFTGAGAGILATGTGNAGKFAVRLDDGAFLKGETEGAYVNGTVTTTRTLLAQSTPNKFGNIGLDLKVARDIGSIIVTRNSIVYQGAGTSVSINRGFSLTPDDSDPVTVDLTFHYLNDDRNGIAPENLRLFSSETGDIPFVALNKTSNDPTAKILSLNGLNSSLLNLFTLGDAANPLPVTLTSFTATATAQGAALLRWTTATETNNRGFGIERQLDTNEAWQSVGFVAAQATTGSTYEFTDKSLVSAPASKQAYYRLRQEDLNGVVTYSPVAAINRTGAVTSTELTLSPVPVGGTDNLSVGLAEAGQAGIVVAVINTQGQRLMSFTTQASTDAALSLPVTSLAAGVYIVTVQVPGQAARHARFVKL